MKEEYLKEALKESNLLLKISVVKIALISAFIIIYLFNLDIIFDFIYLITEGHKILTMIGSGFYMLIFACALMILGFQFTSCDYYYKETLYYKEKLNKL